LSLVQQKVIVRALRYALATAASDRQAPLDASSTASPTLPIPARLP
jgi:hypothetical protein